MKAATILISSLAPSFLLAQVTSTERNPWKAAPAAIPETVAKARIHAQTVMPGASGIAGGNLILQRIDPPVFTPTAPVPEPAKQARSWV